eukprot:gb/GEZN01006815.1/.p1 GENE.gb/GEZN01006815.1/~~gb/GEZN01006815.1/.p1  ORF type:complete len:416 (-),score=42.88 gb/GEZN01006815.1/:182-1429(-)
MPLELKGPPTLDELDLKTDVSTPSSEATPVFTGSPSKHEIFNLFFEGPEKLLEILWLPEEGSKSLRSIPQVTWEKVLKLVRCTILNKTSSDFCDAYVLSESSLFVYPSKIILKTCGTTTLLRALSTILNVAKKQCSLTIIDDLWYSRRNFFEPQKQLEPHGSWKKEVEFLDSLVHGSSYILGSTNDMHWYMYVTDRAEVHSTAGVPLKVKPQLNKMPSLSLMEAPRKLPKQGSCTLEVLMHDLDGAVAAQFYNSRADSPDAWPALTKNVTRTSGIGSLIPGSIIDDYLFNPCGYSMNGLKGRNYWTIHITPQPSCSYASFETDLMCDYGALLERILTVFKPGMFTVSFVAHELSQDAIGGTIQSLLAVPSHHGFGGRPRVRLTLDNGYELAFVPFRKAEHPAVKAELASPACIAS